MFVDVGRIDGRNDVFYADGSSEIEPSKEKVIEAIESFNDGEYKVVEDERPVRIWMDSMMGFWRFSAHVKKSNIQML